MNCLLVHNYFLAEDVVEQKVMRPYPPLGILSISAYLEKNAWDHEVFDGTFSTQEKLFNLIRENKPAYIGFYVNFLVRQKVLETITFIKKNTPETTIIIGGPDAKFHAENYLENGADFIVMGEGEETLFSLLDHLQNGKEPVNNPGIAYKLNNKFYINPLRELIKDIDALPVPNRKKIDIQKYLSTWKTHHGYSSLTINTQRGCPYTCKWCSHAVYGDTYRRRSPGTVVQELKQLIIEYNPDRFWFVDDVFTMSKKWLAEFKEELIKQQVRIKYECITRADKMDEEIISLLKATGCELVWIGAESGSQKMLDLMDRRVLAEQVREMIKLSKRQNIETGTFVMLGYPGEKKHDILETIKHLKDCNPDFFTINKAYPIKGTGLYDKVEEIIKEDYLWETTPDHHIDFQRTYPSRFYEYAIRKTYNEVWAHKFSEKGKWLPALKCKVKSIIATIGMELSK
jgi:radical SAM superfamily enzyme YgiQ (UPF0313 family)